MVQAAQGGGGEGPEGSSEAPLSLSHRGLPVPQGTSGVTCPAHMRCRSHGGPQTRVPASPRQLTQRPAVHLVRIETTRWPGAWLRGF